VSSCVSLWYSSTGQNVRKILVPALLKDNEQEIER
jgi:hypothetical protein